MTRYYVTMTWDNWPSIGSFGTVVEAESPAEAEEKCRLEMAESQATSEHSEQSILEKRGTKWFTVDCFDLDEFIHGHQKPYTAWILYIRFRQGDSAASIHTTKELAEQALVDLVNGWWSDDMDSPKPSDPKETVAAYFESPVGHSAEILESDRPDKIDTSDIPEVSEAWFKNAKLRHPAINAETNVGAFPSLAIVLEGGMVQSIVSDQPDALNLEAVYVIDYDTEGADGNDVSYVRQSDGSYADAYVHDEGVESARVDLNQVARELDARRVANDAGWSHDRIAFDGESFTHRDGRHSEAKTWADLCEEQGAASPEALTRAERR